MTRLTAPLPVIRTRCASAPKDVAAAQWMNWFNGPVQQVFQADGFFDPQGLFVGDASYLFVPDNPA